MSFWMHWAVIGVADAASSVTDVAEAVAVFDRSIHAVQQKACTPPEAAASAVSAGAVRTRMATDGSTAMARGQEWRTRAGDVEVVFRPRSA